MSGVSEVSVMVVDDHPMWRDGVSRDLTEAGFTVAATADGVGTAARRAAAVQPDVVLMDMQLIDGSGAQATAEVLRVSPHSRVLVLSASAERDDVLEAIKAGATGYLLKEISIEEVADAIRAVVSGQSLISPSMASKLLTEFTNLAKKADEKQAVPSPRLTDRELEVLKLVAQGMSNREIAGELYISENTVKNHVRNILEKLHLHSRMEAVLFAVRERLFDLE